MTPRPLLVGISGPSGSGKSELADALLARLGDTAARLAHDAYYHDASQLPEDERARINFDHPDSLDNALFVEHLASLAAGREVGEPIYDFASHSREAGVRTVRPAPVVLAEGILVLAVGSIAARLDLRVYVDTPLDVCLARRRDRDVAQRGRTPESVDAQWHASVLPMHREFVLPCRHDADVVLSGEQPVERGVEALLQVLRPRLGAALR